MSDPTGNALLARIKELEEALRAMIAEYGDDHYHTCPADDRIGPCDCFGGHLNERAKKALNGNHS